MLLSLHPRTHQAHRYCRACWITKTRQERVQHSLSLHGVSVGTRFVFVLEFSTFYTWTRQLRLLPHNADDHWNQINDIKVHAHTCIISILKVWGTGTRNADKNAYMDKKPTNISNFYNILRNLRTDRFERRGWAATCRREAVYFRESRLLAQHLRVVLGQLQRHRTEEGCVKIFGSRAGQDTMLVLTDKWKWMKQKLNTEAQQLCSIRSASLLPWNKGSPEDISAKMHPISPTRPLQSRSSDNSPLWDSSHALHSPNNAKIGNLVAEQQLRGSVPAGRHVVCQRVLAFLAHLLHEFCAQKPE